MHLFPLYQLREIKEEIVYHLVTLKIWLLDLHLPMHSVPITINVVNSNPAHGELYSIQHYMIKFVSDLRQVGCFLPPINLIATIQLKYC